MITENAVVDLVYPYVKGKPDILVSVGIITPSEVSKICIGTDGTILPVPDTTYEIGSITKSFVASLIVELIHRGTISLSDHVRNGVTLEQLLTHSSGIQEYPLLQTGVENPFSHITADDVISYAGDTEIGPRDWEYSNTGFSLIGVYLSEKLKQENSLLWLARKQQSEEKGRLAETKLTLPLMILLLVLIMMTIAPAMMEI